MNPGRSSSLNGSGMVRSVMLCLRSINSNELVATVVSSSALIELTKTPTMIKPTTNNRMNEMTTPVTVASTYLKNDFMCMLIIRCFKLRKTSLYWQMAYPHAKGLTTLNLIRYKCGYLDMTGRLPKFAYRSRSISFLCWLQRTPIYYWVQTWTTGLPN